MSFKNPEFHQFWHNEIVNSFGGYMLAVFVSKA